MEAGNNFTGAVADSTHFILNETAVRQAGIKDPIGKRFRLWKKEGTIIGVVKDFHFAYLRQKIEPAVFYYEPQESRRLFIRTTGKDAPKAIAAAERAWKQYNADTPFSYCFLSTLYDQQYRGEQRLSAGPYLYLPASLPSSLPCSPSVSNRSKQPWPTR